MAHEFLTNLCSKILRIKKICLNCKDSHKPAKTSLDEAA